MLTLSSFGPKQMSVAAILSLLCGTNARHADMWEEVQCSGSSGIVRDAIGQASALLPRVPHHSDWAWPVKTVPKALGCVHFFLECNKAGFAFFYPQIKMQK